MTENNVVQLVEHMGRSYRRSLVPMHPTRVESIRALLVQELQKETVPTSEHGWVFSFPSFSTFFHLNALRPVLAVFVLAVFGAGSLLRVAAASLPGDALYTVKLVREQAQVRLTTNAKARAKLTVQFAVQRADEVRQLVNREEPASEKAEHLAIAVRGLESHVTVMTDALVKLTDKKEFTDLVEDGAVQITSLLDDAKHAAIKDDGVVEQKVSDALQSMNETRALVELAANPPTTLVTSVSLQAPVIEQVSELQKARRNFIQPSAALTNPAMSVFSLPVAQSVHSEGILPIAVSVNSAP